MAIILSYTLTCPEVLSFFLKKFHFSLPHGKNDSGIIHKLYRGQLSGISGATIWDLSNVNIT